jgi:hypothetical protein
MTTLRILVTGSRTWTDVNALGEALYAAINDSGADEVTIVHGACPSGADRMAAEFCESEAEWFDGMGRQLAEEAHPAERFGSWPGCGPRRNRHMVSLGADVCVAFIEPCTRPACRKPRPHDSHGTAGTVELCERAGIPVRPVRAGVPLRAPS